MSATGDIRLPVAASGLLLLGHDLRAAMSDIIGGLRLIDQSQLDDDTRLQLERIRAAGESLARLLEEGLNLLPGEDGPGDSHPTTVHFARLLYDVEMRWSGRAQERGLVFQLVTAEDLPKHLSLERISLERILSNLLSNAIKYTDRGVVLMSVRREGDDILFTVRDSGPGFAEDMLGALFTQKRRGKRSRPGTGLGLRITKEMADRLGATVSAANLPMGGAEVVVRLPPEAWTSPPDAAEETQSELPDLRGQSVLLAEDSRTNQAILSAMLNTMGAQVQVASDGIEAVSLLHLHRFDLALIDIEMPRLSGIEVIKTLRALPGEAGRIPVLAVTAYVLRANRTAIYRAGADMILAKPILSIEPFAQAISAVRTTAGPLPEPFDAPQVEDDSPVLEAERFNQLLRIAGPDGRRELLTRLIADLKEVERGLVHGLANSERPEIRAHTHVLIALAGAVGATRLQRRAEALNRAAHQGRNDCMEEMGQDLLQQLDALIHTVGQEAQAFGVAV